MAFEITRSFLDGVEYDENDMATSFHEIFGNITNSAKTIVGNNVIVSHVSMLMEGYFVYFIGSETIAIPDNFNGLIYIGYDWTNGIYEVGASISEMPSVGTMLYRTLFYVKRTSNGIRITNPPINATIIYDDDTGFNTSKTFVGQTLTNYAYLEIFYYGNRGNIYPYSSIKVVPISGKQISLLTSYIGSSAITLQATRYLIGTNSLTLQAGKAAAIGGPTSDGNEIYINKIVGYLN